MAKPEKKKGGGVKLAVAGGVVLAMMGAGKHARGIAADLSSLGGAGQYTPVSWAHTLLKAEGLPRTACNMGAITAWEAAEGGNWQNSAAYNPLNTTYDNGGAWEASGKVTGTINGDGVRAYNSWHTGFVATYRTLSLYPGILGALQAGNDAQAVADAVASSPWGTGGFTANC